MKTKEEYQKERKIKQENFRKNNLKKFIDIVKSGEDLPNSVVAIIFYLAGIEPNVSSSIADTITYGYGSLDSNGFWQYQLPNSLMEDENEI